MCIVGCAHSRCCTYGGEKQYVTKPWKLLLDRDMMRKDLQREIGVSRASATKMSKGEVVGTEILMKVCKTLHCDIGDIVEFIEDETDE